MWHKIYFQFSRRTQRAETPQKLIVAVAFCLRGENSPCALRVSPLYILCVCEKRENERAPLLHLQAKIFSTAISPFKKDHSAKLSQRYECQVGWKSYYYYFSDFLHVWVYRSGRFSSLSPRQKRLDKSKADSYFVCVRWKWEKLQGRLSVLLSVHSIMKRGINQRAPSMKSYHKQWPHERL